MAHRNRWFTMVYLINMVIYILVYQRVRVVMTSYLVQWTMVLNDLINQQRWRSSLRRFYEWEWNSLKQNMDQSRGRKVGRLANCHDKVGLTWKRSTFPTAIGMYVLSDSCGNCSATMSRAHRHTQNENLPYLLVEWPDTHFSTFFSFIFSRWCPQWNVCCFMLFIKPMHHSPVRYIYHDHNQAQSYSPSETNSDITIQL